jgi:hypothetical protein
MYRTIASFRIPAAKPAAFTTSASRAASSTNVRVGCFADTGAPGPTCVTVVPICAETATVLAFAPSTPEVRTTPSVVVTVVAPSATRTWNAVPCTELVDVGVSTE